MKENFIIDFRSTPFQDSPAPTEADDGPIDTEETRHWAAERRFEESLGRPQPWKLGPAVFGEKDSRAP